MHRKLIVALSCITPLIVGLLPVAKAADAATSPSASAAPSASTSYNDPLFGNHVHVVPKGWPPPFGPECHNTPEEVDDAHTVHALGLAALDRKLPHEALYYWRLAYVESCKTPKILVNIAVAAEQAGEIAGAIEALELLESRGTLKEEDHLANQKKLSELRAMLAKPAPLASASATTWASVSAAPSASASTSAPPVAIAPKSQTNWLAITGFSLAGVGL